MASLHPLLLGSCSRAFGNRCAAQIRPPTPAIMPYLMLALCAACGLLVSAQEVAAAPIPLSARRSMHLADRPGPASQLDALETRRRDDLAMPQAHALS